MEATKELMEACGFHNLACIVPSKFFRRVNEYQVKNFEQIYFPGKQNNWQHKYSSQLN
jgi:hypothetical protein